MIDEKSIYGWEVASIERKGEGESVLVNYYIFGPSKDRLNAP